MPPSSAALDLVEPSLNIIFAYPTLLTLGPSSAVSWLWLGWSVDSNGEEIEDIFVAYAKSSCAVPTWTDQEQTTLLTQHRRFNI